MLARLRIQLIIARCHQPDQRQIIVLSYLHGKELEHEENISNAERRFRAMGRHLHFAMLVAARRSSERRAGQKNAHRHSEHRH